MTNKTIKIPRIIAMARYADIPNLLKPKDINAKLLSDIKNDESRILFYLFEYLELNENFTGSMTDLYRLLFPEKKATQVSVKRVYQKVWQLSGVNFTLPKRLNDKGEVDFTSTTKLFDLVENNELKTDKRVSTVVVLSKPNVMEYYTNQKKFNGKNSGFVKLNNLELEGKTLNLKTKQQDLFNRINDYLSYVKETKLVNKTQWTTELSYFCEKIGSLKQFRKNRKEALPRVEAIIKVMINNQILIKQYQFDDKKDEIIIDFF